VIKLLRVLVEDIAISLDRGNIHYLIDIGQELRERSINGTSLDILIEITSRYEFRIGVEIKDSFYKVLPTGVNDEEEDGGAGSPLLYRLVHCERR
jgi:hypothetical protein